MNMHVLPRKYGGLLERVFVFPVLGQASVDKYRTKFGCLEGDSPTLTHADTHTQ